MNETSAEAIVRIKSERIVSWAYTNHEAMVGRDPINILGEAVEVKAEGHLVLDNNLFPISVHMTVPPGCGLVPSFGDNYKVLVSRLEDGEPI